MANINSINGNPIVLDSNGIADESVTEKKLLSEFSSGTHNINTAETGKYGMNSSGTIVTGSDSHFGMKNAVPCEESTYYVISFPKVFGPNSKTVGILYLDENNSVIAQKYFSSYDGDSACTLSPSGAKYIYCFINSGGMYALETDRYIQIEKGIVPHPYIYPKSLVDAVARDATDSLNKKYGMSEISPSSYSGYIGGDGDIHTASPSLQERYTDRIDIGRYSSFEWSLAYTEERPLWCVYATYDEDSNFISMVQLHFGGNAIALGGRLDAADFASSIKYIAFSWRTFGESNIEIKASPNINALADRVDDVIANAADTSKMIDNVNIAITPFRFKPLYDHLFVNKTGGNIVIPHESVYHVRLTRKFGFNMIEANVWSTSDGVYVVNHLSGGKFGGYFHHVDGSTDISDVALASVTWDWVSENVRYNSTIGKYETRPCTLEEFLRECRQQNVIPFLQATNSEIIEIADEIMGKGNYVAYAASRNDCPSAIIYHFKDEATKEEIVNYCNSIGRPFIYGMANPDRFTDEELEDIIKTLHENGYWIGVSYANMLWYKYSAMGVDVNGSQMQMNRIDNGNVCNIYSTAGFSGYVVINAVENDGVLTFTSTGTITPNIDEPQIGMYGVDIEVLFVGTITIPTIGEMAGGTYRSDGSIPLFISAPIINGNPKVSINCDAGTVVTDMTYKITSV